MITLRPATLTDMATLFEWRNEPSTYEFFRNPHPITGTEHKFWVDAVMNDIVMAESFTSLIGMVRFDALDRGTEVSITLAPEKRGQGLGYIVLSMAIKDHQRPLLAQIHRKNVASKRIFEQCHFEELGGDGDFVLYRREPQ